MKKLLPLMLIAILTMGMSGCGVFKTKLLPKLKEVSAKKLVDVIVEQGECSAVSEVKDDVYKLLKLEGDEGAMVKALGSTAPEGSQQEGVVSAICMAAAKLALPALLSKGVPEKWECKLTSLGSKISNLAEMACGKIPL